MDSEEGPRSFAVLISELSCGEIDQECSKKFQKLLAALEDEAGRKGGKASGTLNLGLTCEVDNKGNLNIAFAVETKEPKKKLEGGVCWVTKGSNYSLEPPKKRQGLREVSGGERIEEPRAQEARSL